MAYLILPSRRTRQPGSPVGIAASGLSNGLSFAFDGVVRRNAVNSNILASVNAPTQGAYADGMRTVFASASSQYMEGGTGADVTFAGGALTVALRYSLTTIPSSGSAFSLFTRDNNTGGRSYTVDVQNTSGSDKGLRLYVNGGGGSIGSNIVYEGRQPVAGDDRFCVAVWDNGNNRSEVWVDGVLVNSSGASNVIPSASTPLAIGRRAYSGFNDYHNGSIGYIAAWKRGLSRSEIIELSRNPWQIFAPDPRRLYFGVSGGAGAVTGTLSATDGADAASFSGTHTAPSVTGTLAATDGADAAAFAGVEAFTGTLAATDGADAAAFSGSSLSGVSGTLAATDGADAAAFSGLHTVNVTGTLAATEGADLATFTGIHLQNITGTFTGTDGADAAAFIGALASSVTGTLAATDGADACYFYEIATAAPEVTKVIDNTPARIGSSTIDRSPARLGSASLRPVRPRL